MEYRLNLLNTWKILHEKKHVFESSSELPFLIFSKDSSVLHIGCGSGSQIQYIKSKFGSICIGIDIVPFKTPNFLVADASHLPFRDEMFSITYSLGVIEHIKLTQKAIDESVRILKLNGQCLHSVPNMFSLHTFLERPLINLLFKKWSVGFEQSFTPKKIKQMFNNCGFNKIKQKIVVKNRGESKMYKLSKIESVIYQTLKDIDRLFSKIIPNWGFFIFTYGTKNSNHI